MRLRSFLAFDEQWESIREVSIKEKVSISEIIRKALELYLNNFHGKNGGTYFTVKEERVVYRVTIEPKDSPEKTVP